MDIIFVYMTAPNQAVADMLAALLVEQRLAACINMLPGMISVYRWEGKTERATEIVLIAKTTSGKFADLEAAVKAHHPYETPCIVALPVTIGSVTFLKWIEESVN